MSPVGSTLVSRTTTTSADGAPQPGVQCARPGRAAGSSGRPRPSAGPPPPRALRPARPTARPRPRRPRRRRATSGPGRRAPARGRPASPSRRGSRSRGPSPARRVATAPPTTIRSGPSPASSTVGAAAGDSAKSVPVSTIRQPAASISARSRSASGQFRAARACNRACAAARTASGIRCRLTNGALLRTSSVEDIASRSDYHEPPFTSDESEIPRDRRRRLARHRLPGAAGSATFPTWAHMIGDYGYVDQFEEVGREARGPPDRRGPRVRRAGRGDPRSTACRPTTGSPARWSPGTAGATPTSSRPASTSSASTRSSACRRRLAGPDPEAADPRRRRRRGDDRQVPRHRDVLPRPGRPAPRGRRPRPDARPTSPSARPSSSSTAGSPTPIAEDPLLNTAEPAPASPISRRGRAASRAVIESDVRPAIADVPRHAPRRRPAARPRRRQVRAVLARRRRRGLRRGDPLLHDGRPESAQEIHDIGLAPDRDRWPASTASWARRSSARATCREIFAALRDDPSLHHTNGDDIVAASKAAMAKARAAMGDWFGILPKADCDVEATTNGAIAYYFPPAKDGSRGGVFFMNTSDPTGWGRYQIESTSYHEGIPGHHLQLAIAAELDVDPGVPQARLHRRLRRGLGPLHRAARRRDGPLLDARSTGWGCSRPTRCGPAGSSSTPGCTRSAGAASRRSTT